MYNRISLFIISAFVNLAAFSQTKFLAQRLEKRIISVSKEVMPAVVKIAAFDTLSQTLAVSRFSGVIVDQNGTILTAAHATQPKQIYQVSLPDGGKVLAQGLGRISLGKEKPATDVAMLKILGKKKWPFVKMGSSSSLKIGQPCIGISFPGTFEQTLPNIRLGRLENVNIVNGSFQSSCKMEPGDSGGPLFDDMGYLIGIHSWILSDEKLNFEVPIDLFKKYWSALKIPISYSSLPSENATELVRKSIGEDSIPPIDLLSKVSDANFNSVVNIQSSVGGKPTFSLGTIIKVREIKEHSTFVVTQSASIGTHAQIILNGKAYDTVILGRDVPNNLALLKINENLLWGLSFPQNFGLNLPSPGSLLCSALPGHKSKIGIVSTGPINMSLKYSSGYFGAGAKFIDGKVTISEIQKGSPSEKILMLGDKIISINGNIIDLPEKYGAELSKLYPYENVNINLLRNGQNINFNLLLGIYRSQRHTADAFPGGRSVRSDGFGRIIVQDAAIRPEECGGPVFDLKGNFVGINVGRHSRTSTIIMPRDIIFLFFSRYFNQKI